MNTPGIIWLKNGRILKQVDDTVSTVPTLEKKIYNMGFDPNRNEIFLEEFAEEFHFDFKIYGMENRLISHIMKTFENTSGNLGILFNGTKGTGKTITAKIIANKMQLPVILVNDPFPGISDFVSKINSPCILFFDEFEKTFSTDRKQDLDILAIMDGVYNSPHRRIFLLTTNKLYINENLIGRPSRIRYRKSFGNLSPEVIKEYLDDNLKNKEYAQEIIDFIDGLSISTIDILKSVIEEVNIHNTSLNHFKGFLNVEAAKHAYTVDSKRLYDNDAEYGIKEFKADLAKVGTKEKDEDGEEYTITKGHLNIYTRRVNTSSTIELLFAGDEFGSYGRVVDPVDKDGFLTTEDEYGERWIFKVHNLDTKPSLYRGGLVY